MNSDASGMRTDHLGWMVSSDMDRPRSFHFDGCTLLGRRDGDGESKTPAKRATKKRVMDWAR